MEAVDPLSATAREHTLPPFRQALRRALAFLLARQGADGLWRDFLTLAGESADWVGGYVAASVWPATGPTPSLERAVTALLAGHHDDGGWGYHQGVPTDADSTAYVSLFLAAYRPNSPILDRAARCLAAHQGEDGGVATYLLSSAIRRLMGLADDADIGGWCQPDAAVTAAAGRAWTVLGDGWLPAARAAWRFLEAAQLPDGFWSSYWWTSPQYPTYQAIHLAGRLARNGRQPAAVARALAWLEQSQLPSGGWADGPGLPESDFATALAVAGLAAAAGGRTALRLGVVRLLERQQADGGWLSRPIMRVPPPDVRDLRAVARWRYNSLGTGVIIRDQHRLYTTATAVQALMLAAGEGRRVPPD